MPEYVIMREVEGGACFLCAITVENPLTVPGLFWEVLELPLKRETDVLVMGSEIEAHRVKREASCLEDPYLRSLGPCRIMRWADVSDEPGEAASSTVVMDAGRSPLTCPSFDRLPPEVQTYTALQVLVAEIIKTCQCVGGKKFIGGTFDRHLIEHCENALYAYRESLEGAVVAERKSNDPGETVRA